MDTLKRWIAVALLTVFALTACQISQEQLQVADVSAGEVSFVYDTKDIHEPLAQEDLQQIKQMLNGKILCADYPGCGFSKKISISLDGLIICVPKDTCGALWLPEQKQSIYLDEAENGLLRQILSQYGFVWPCL